MKEIVTTAKQMLSLKKIADAFLGNFDQRIENIPNTNAVNVAFKFYNYHFCPMKCEFVSSPFLSRDVKANSIPTATEERK